MLLLELVGNSSRTSELFQHGVFELSCPSVSPPLRVTPVIVPGAVSSYIHHYEPSSAEYKA